jgi:2-succinyl-5-enolpyruvyl-6-hydroxy-3-cyclohexene-1-carboxylate synthase
MEQNIINNIAEICYQQGIEKAIISPGSRNAPLTLAFVRHPKIQCYSISDERSAAFIGLGMAQANQKAIALICTSGSAALNYAPAVAEAFFQEVPLLILTADRPPEWIDQWDGQTIRQENIYGKHIKKSFNIQADLSHKDAIWHTYRIVNEAALATTSDAQGPVHINIPFREPFYPATDMEWKYDINSNIIHNISGAKTLSKEEATTLTVVFEATSRIAFVLGQEDYSEEFLQTLDNISHQLNIPVFTDIISNGYGLKNAIHLPDSVCMQMIKVAADQEVPELVVSFGKSIISKNLKMFLRNHVNRQWHVREHQHFFSDPFQKLSKVIACQPQSFLEAISKVKAKPDNFLQQWIVRNQKVMEKTSHFLSNQLQFNEFSALNFIIKALPENTHLHLANSLTVRYVNFIGLKGKNNITVWANRGTSGIDGSNSSAMGHALAAKDKQHFLVTGDVAFFYDRNAFWHKYPYPNLKIILLNNQGGSIFRMIPGPRDQAELEEYFETEQKLNAKSLCEEFGIHHFEVNNYNQLENNLDDFIEGSAAAILEINSNSKSNQKIFEDFKKHIQQ